MRHKSSRASWFPSFVFIVLLVLLQACNLPFLSKAPSSTRITALRNLEKASASKPAFTFQTGFPLSGRFDILVEGANPVERARNFLTTYRDLYGQTSPDLGLELLRADGDNNQHVVFYQTYKNIPVFGGELVVELKGDHVIFASGNLLHGDMNIDTTPQLTALEAESAARSALNAPDTSVQGVSKLMIYDPSMFGDVAPDPHLTWRVNLSTGSTEVYVDAHTRSLVFSYSLSEDIYDLDLEIANGESAANSNCYYATNKDDSVGDEETLEKKYLTDPDVSDMWHYAQDAYNFYDTMGRDSFDNHGKQLEIYTYVNLDNAHWDAGCQIFEFGGGWVGQDVMVHEFTHAVISYTSNLVYQGESGALNESFADIMAAAQDGNWTIGEAMTKHAQLRDMSYPSDTDQYVITEDDHGGVHTNSAIHNYVAYLLAVGGVHHSITVQGIGAAKEAVLMLQNLYTLPKNAQFITARDNAVGWALYWAAGNDHGFTDFDVCQVRNAYAAVGIGVKGVDSNCDGLEDFGDEDQDYVVNKFDNCQGFASTDLSDLDKDGIGDVCDPDKDNDGQPNESDNCPLVVNDDQSDADGNGVGDACQDTDGDTKVGVEDNCPVNANLDQLDNDADGQGDVCDPDDDNDGHDDLNDNAPFVANPTQTDGDKDNVGDVIDNCLRTPNPGQEDLDKDKSGDACDGDIDNDGQGNERDNCPADSNPDQADLNKNGIGTVCDAEEQALLESAHNKADLTLITSPGAIFKVKLPLCAGGCPDDWGLDTFLVDVQVENLFKGVAAFVGDDSGAIVSKSSLDGSFQDINFSPQGGHDYFLNIAFGPDVEAGQEMGFSVDVSEGAGSGAPQPTPTGPTSTPLPLPPSFGATPTPTPAAASAPTFTLTKNAFCRKGPDVSFPDVDAILKGETVDILNVSEDGFWYYVYWKQKNAKCWVAASAGQANGQLQGVQVLIGPATLTPTPAPFEPSPTATGKP